MSQALDREAFEAMWRRLSGTDRRWTVVNNQVIGARIMAIACGFFAIGLVMALLMRIQLTHAGNTFLGPDDYNRLFTMHGSIMMYMFIVPFLEGLAVYLLPALVGSRDMAFPRITAFGFWLYAIGGAIFLASFFVGRGPDMGWFAYTPLSGPRYTGPAVDLWLWGLTLVEVGGIVTALEIVVTVLKLRAPGMAIDRMPLFAWAMLVTGVMMIFAFTTLLTATLMLEADRTFGTAYFDPTRGGSSLLWQHLFWFFGHPEVYIMFIPAVGIVSMLTSTFARRAIAGYTPLVVATILMGFVSFGLWMHHMFTTGLPELSMAFFSAASLMIALASGTQVFSWIATLWGTRPAMQVPLLYALGFLVLFVVGGMTGVMVAVVPFDWQVHDTYFVVAHFHYVLIGGVLFPILGALVYWLPKMTGRLLSPALGRWAFGLIVVGFNLTFFPMHLMGLWGMPRRVYTYDASLGVDGLNAVSTAGAFVLAVGLGLFALDVGRAFRRGAAAGPDPWGGFSLEWALPSPAPAHNHYALPYIEGRSPLWEQPFGPQPGLLAGRPATFRATVVTDAVSARPQALHYLAGPSAMPLVASAAAGALALAAVAKAPWVALGAAGVLVVAVVLWLWPPASEVATVAASDDGLPVFPAGTHSPAWWGAVGLLGVLATVFGALLYGYCYLWLFSPAWPQGGLPRPAWGQAAGAFGAGVAGALAARWALAHTAVPRKAGVGLATAAIGQGGAIALLALALAGAGFAPTVNAYATAFHVTQWLWLLVAAAGLGLSVAAAVLVRRPGPGWGLLIGQISSLYTAMVAALGVAVFAVLYVAPHLLGGAP